MPYSSKYSKIKISDPSVILVQPCDLPQSDENLLNLSQHPNSDLMKIGWYRVFEPDAPEFDPNIEYLQYSEYFFSDTEKRVERTVSVSQRQESDRIRKLNEDAVQYINSKITSTDRQTLNELSGGTLKPAFEQAYCEVKQWIESVLDYQTMKQQQVGETWDYSDFDSTFPYTYEQLLNMR